jgi:WD40 repeat protein
MKLAGDLKNIVARPFAFYANDRIIGQHRKDPDKSGIFTFPEGKQVERFYMNADSYTRTHKGDYILVRPTTTNPVGVFDFKNQKFVASNKTEALAGYGNFFISEGKDGIVDLYEVDPASNSMNNRGTLFLPKNDFGDIRSVSFSPDMKWLLVSESARAGIWDLSDGRMKQYIQGVRGSHFDDGKVYVDVPRSKAEPRTMAVINMEDGSGEKLDGLQSPRVRQFGKHLVKLTTKQEEEQAERLAKQRAKNKKNGDTPPEGDAPGGERSGPTITIAGPFAGISLGRGGEFRKDGTLEVYDAASRNLLWSRKFEDEIPQYRFDISSETVILYWRVTTKAAKAQIKARPDLDAKAKELGDKDGDFLVLVLDSNTGAQKGAVLIETGEGSFSIERVLSAGNWLAIIDTENRVLLYSLADGELVWRFFGSDAALNPQKDQIVIENFAGQISIYDLATGEKTDDLLFKSSVAFLRFGPRGERLFVLTGDQEYMIFDTAGFGKPDDARIGLDQ